MNISVKDRLRKMQNQKRKKPKSIWNTKGAVREIIKDFHKYIKYKSQIIQYSGFTDFPNSLVDKVENGYEHPKRNATCHICSIPINSMLKYETLADGTITHSECLTKLMYIA